MITVGSRLLGRFLFACLGQNPVVVLADAGVDAVELRPRAADAEADNPGQLPAAVAVRHDKGTAAVAVAGIFTPFAVTGA